MFFRRSKLRCLLSLDFVEVLSLIQHNLYLLSFLVPLRIANLHNYPESYALSLESGFSSVDSSVVFKHSSVAAAVTLSRRMALDPSTDRVIFLVDAIRTFIHEFVISLRTRVHAESASICSQTRVCCEFVLDCLLISYFFLKDINIDSFQAKCSFLDLESVIARRR